MDEMLKELEETLSQCSTQMKTFNTTLKSCLKTFDICNIDYSFLFLALYENPYKPEFINQAAINGPNYSFGLSQRFKEKPKEQPEEPLEYSVSTIKVFKLQNFQTIQKSQPNVVFTKTQRFVEPKPQELTLIDPNYDFVKRKAPGVKIMEPTFIEDDISTQASMTVGPGAYDPAPAKPKKQSDWSKGDRFPKEQAEQIPLLYPNLDAIKPSIKTTKILKQTQKTKYLIRKQEIEEMDEKLRISMYMKRPLEYDQAVKPQIKGVVIKEAYNDFKQHPPGSRMRRFLIRKLMDDLQQFIVGPGSYETYVEKQPCMVVFKSHSSERRGLPDKPTPGPDYYYSKDDLIKPKAIQVVFAKDGIEPKLPQLDLRPNLEVNIDPTKQKAPEVVRWDVKETQPKLTLQVERAGPGYYDPSHELVEPRVKATKIAALNDKNDRIQQMDPTKGQDFNDYEEILYPNLEGILPHAPEFKYHEPTVQQPQHVPDQELFPEQIKFYDVNLNAVREQIAKDIPIAGKKGRGLEEWLEYVDDMNMFHDYMNRRNRIPEVGEYQVKFDVIDPNPKTVDFRRYKAADHDFEKPEGPVDGDNLILNPQPVVPHIPGVDFEKQSSPRKEEPIKEVELILNPTYDLVKPRVKNIPDFEKQLDRPPSPKKMEQEAWIEPNHAQVQPRVKGNIVIEKQPAREDDPRYQHKVDDKPLFLEPKVQKNEKTAVQMNSKTKRFNSQQQKKAEEIPPPVNLSKIEKAQKAIKPNVPRINMAKQSSRKK